MSDKVQKILTIYDYAGSSNKICMKEGVATLSYKFNQISMEEIENYHGSSDIMLINITQKNINSLIPKLANNPDLKKIPAVLIVDEDIPHNELSEINLIDILVVKHHKEMENFEINLPTILRKHEVKSKLKDTENRIQQLKEENIRLKVELNQVNKENEFNKLNIDELTATNEHLIAATWRERDLKKQLTDAMDEVTKSKQLIEIQNKKISESINYSRRIQNVILPDEELIKKDLKQSFILYLPKDIVSGDFPFYYKDDNAVYIAAIDCTGHGVPGAMLSLIGNLTLNDILNDPGKKMPSEILKELHSKVVKTLKQDIEGNDASDGMDIALCAIDYKENIIRYSGAHRPMYHIRNNELIEYKGTRLPIGGTQYKKETKFIDYEIEIMEGDLFFIFSDGYPDQFGGPSNIKYGSGRIQNYLLTHQHLSMDELKEGLRREFLEWKGEHKQMDDILFIGFKF